MQPIIQPCNHGVRDVLIYDDTAGELVKTVEGGWMRGALTSVTETVLAECRAQSMAISTTLGRFTHDIADFDCSHLIK